MELLEYQKAVDGIMIDIEKRDFEAAHHKYDSLIDRLLRDIYSSCDSELAEVIATVLSVDKFPRW